MIRCLCLEREFGVEPDNEKISGQFLAQTHQLRTLAAADMSC